MDDTDDLIEDDDVDNDETVVVMKKYMTIT